MNLEEVRQEFVKRSGRYDLVTIRGDDNGADSFIKAGNRFLDRAAKYLRADAQQEVTITSGYSFTVERCRIITSVWAREDVAGKSFIELERVTDNIMRRMFPQPWDDLTPGHPLIYAVSSLRPIPDTSRAFSTWTVQFLPRIETAYVFQLHGEFSSKILQNDTDTNFWSDQHPDILLMATFRALEVFYRNTQGVKDWEMAIATELMTLEKDFVEDETHDINQMEG